jgi:hypothetical protein
MYVLIQGFKIGNYLIEILQDGLRSTRRVHSYLPPQRWWISVKASAVISD